MRRVLPGVALAVLTAALPPAGQAATLTTPTIASRTVAASLSCMRWRPVGVCFWLRCSLSGCRVRTSIKVGHYNPDLVVSVYNTLGGNPWTEMRASLGLAQRTAARGLLGSLLAVPVGGGANRSEGAVGRREHRNLLYREADAIGNPVPVLSSSLARAGLLCTSQARGFAPYFLSGLDALAWRQPLAEALLPASLIPGQRELGRWPLHTWGSVYPRTGWATQSDEPKAAALIAQRVGDIVTRRGQGHIYRPLTGPGTRRQRVWPPGPLRERDRRSGLWQMLAPQSERSCQVFGDSDLLARTSWGGGRVDPGGDYAWNLWRPYQCCRRRGQWFLRDVTWASYPP